MLIVEAPAAATSTATVEGGGARADGGGGCRLRQGENRCVDGRRREAKAAGGSGVDCTRRVPMRIELSFSCRISH